MTLTIITAFVSYLGGLISGFVMAKLWQYSKTGTTDAIRGELVLFVVTMIWAVSMIVDIISPQYETSPLVHGLMGAIVGFFYKPKIFDRK